MTAGKRKREINDNQRVTLNIGGGSVLWKHRKVFHLRGGWAWEGGDPAFEAARIRKTEGTRSPSYWREGK